MTDRAKAAVPGHLDRLRRARLDPERRPASMRDAFGAALVELGRSEPRVVVLDGDLANSTRTDAFADAFPQRFFEMGIAEQNMIGVAAGMATAGLIPFAVTFAAFASARDLDQVRLVVAQTRLHVVVVGAYAGLLASRLGKSHVSLEDVALMRALPGMRVVAPADAVEARVELRRAAAAEGPVYIRLARGEVPTLFASADECDGMPVLLRDGSDVALVTTGAQAHRTLEAAGLLARDGIDALVLHVPTIKPLDADAIVAVAGRTGAVVTAEDHSVVGGLGSAVAEVLGERLPTPLARVGTHDVAVESGRDEDLIERYGLSAAHVASATRELLDRLGRQGRGVR